MKYKKIIPKIDIKRDISRGIKTLSSVVETTLGPGGLPILIERTGQELNGDPLGPMITKDGVTVAEQCFDPDPNIDLVVQAVKSICQKTNKIAGDGTTGSIVLAKALLTNAREVLVNHPDVNPQKLKREIEDASQKVINILEKQAVQFEDSEYVEKVATISANGDKEVGKLLREAIETVGPEGAVTVDEGHSSKTELEVVEGFQIERGAEAQDRFFNDKSNTKFEAENCHIILYDGKLTNYQQILTPFENIANKAKENNLKQMPPVLIVANEFSPEVIQWLLIQKAEAGATICAVKSPHTTTVRTQMMDDMAVMLGGSRLGNGNRDLSNSTYDDIGVVERVVATKYKTTFFGGYGDEEDVKERIDQLKAQKEAAESPYDASLIADRISSLSQGIAKLGVGGFTEMEIKEKYHRIEDALNASRAAIQEGVLPGCGCSLLRVYSELEPSKHKSIELGEKVVLDSLEVIFRQILQNLGKSFEEIEELRNEYLKNVSQNHNLVYNANTGNFEDFMKAGVLDPLKVVRTAIENATSIASLLITCGGGIVFKRDS